MSSSIKNYLDKYHEGSILKLKVIDSLKEGFTEAKYIMK